MIFINDLNVVNYLNPFSSSRTIIKTKLMDSDNKVTRIKKRCFYFKHDTSEGISTKENTILFTKESSFHVRRADLR